MDSSGWYDLLVQQRLALEEPSQVVDTHTTHQGVWYLDDRKDQTNETSITLSAIPENNHSFQSLSFVYNRTVF